MVDSPSLALYGASGFAREIAWLLQCVNAHLDTPWLHVGFIDDAAMPGQSLDGLPVVTLQRAQALWAGAAVVCAVGSPSLRAQLRDKARSHGFRSATLVHPGVLLVSGRVTIGPGCTVAAGSVLSVGSSLGEGCQVNFACTIGHNARLGDYATLAPGVHVSGWVHVGARVYVGTGAVIINGTEEAPLTIGDDAIIGAGACVVRPVGAGEVVGGVPAKPLHGQARQNEA